LHQPFIHQEFEKKSPNLISMNINNTTPNLYLGNSPFATATGSAKQRKPRVSSSAAAPATGGKIIAWGYHMAGDPQVNA
jgi:hypothetical protein